MGNLANDSPAIEADLPSGAPPRQVGAGPTLPTAGLSWDVLVALPELAHARPLTPDFPGSTLLTRLVVAADGRLPRPPLTQRLVLTTHAAVAKAGATGGDLPEAISAAGAAGLSLSDDEIGAASTAVLTRLLDRQEALLQRADEVHRALVQIVLGGGDIEALCHQVTGIFDGAAMVTTTDGRVVASAGTDGELERALALGCFDRTGRLIIEHEPVGVRSGWPPSDPRCRRAMVRIVAGSLDHGRLVAFSSRRALSAEDVHLLERAATVAALVITKNQAVSAVETKYRAEFLRDALAGRAGEDDRAVTHARSLGWDIGRRMVVVVAETDEDDTVSGRSRDDVRALQDRFARAWVQAVRVRDETAPVMGFSREVVAVLGVGESADTETTLRGIRDMVRVVSGDGGGGRRSFSTGVSRPVCSPDELPRAYDEALKAVSVGRQMHGDGALTHFDGLGIFRLLALVPDSDDLRRFVAEALGDLAHDESRENADLRHTLAVLLDTNLNVAETARILHFHYNTLRYRIAKLERMLGHFTTDPQLRLTLALALKVVQMRGL